MARHKQCQLLFLANPWGQWVFPHPYSPGKRPKEAYLFISLFSVDTLSYLEADV